MDRISAMPSEIAEWLRGRDELKYIRFLTEFPPVKKAVPLKRITVATGIGGIEIEDTFETSESELTEEYCRSALITLRFHIHAPYSMGGQACHEAFADIIDCLSFDSGLDIITSGCGSISEDRNTDALVLTAYAKVKATLCPAANTDLVFPSFLDKTLFCGSHINDESIHLNESRQAFLNEPFVSGTYYGTGSSTRSFNVGFSPAAVIVGAGDMPPFVADSKGNKIYSATAVKGGGTMGLSLTAEGFRVTNGTAHLFSGAYPALNEAGTLYTYTVLRES